jgi:hypothetical protein
LTILDQMQSLGRAVAVALAALTVFASSAQADFGVRPGSFQASMLDSSGSVVGEPQAGAHPFAQQVELAFNTIVHHFPGSGPDPDPDGAVKTIVTDLPPGLVGNTRGVPQCAQSDFPPSDPSGSGPSRCPTASQVGVAASRVGGESGHEPTTASLAPVYNLVPPKGVIARLGFVQIVPIVIDIKLRTGDDYGITASVKNVSQLVNVYAVSITLWGVPADSSHDAERYESGAGFPGVHEDSSHPLPSGLPRTPFISNPTRCGVESTTSLAVDSWQDPGNLLHYTAPEPMSFTGCNQLEFDPTIEAKPTTNLADAPSGLEFDLHTPQNEDVEGHEDPDGFASAHLRDAVVALPTGMTVNPSAAAVLDACSMAQVGISASGQANGSPVACPNASKIGTVEAVSPAIDHPLPGSLYLASQSDNPFDGLMALYLVLDDPESGLLIKLAGRVDLDRRTGQVTLGFANSPQLPVEDLRLRFFEGPRAVLKTPTACGEHTTTATLTPWSSPEGAVATRSSSFSIGRGPNGGACLPDGAAAPSQPTFTAGTLDPTARAFSPFVLKLARADGSQPLKAIDFTLPEGLLGRLVGVTYCSDAALAVAAGKSGKAEQASPSCPAAARVGRVDVGAGAGPTPVYISGNAYLAGPYKGAPLSLAFVTPAVAGPFDLGDIVVRSALYVDPDTAQIRAVSDPLPTILQGIPLDIRSIALSLDRPRFTLNPTDCDPASVLGGATSVFGQSAALSSPFQVDECGRLRFKPKLALKLSGPTHRSAHPALRAAVRMPGRGANLARATVTLPETELLENAHIGAICSRAEYADDDCSASSVYGYAKVWSPLLDQPLQGSVYLRANGGQHKLPDLVASLDGQVHIDLVGHVDSTRARIRVRFNSLPDAPVSKFVLTMQGGRKGLFANNTDLCRASPRANVMLEGQNRTVVETSPLVDAGCGTSKTFNSKHTSRGKR